MRENHFRRGKITRGGSPLQLDCNQLMQHLKAGPLGSRFLP